MRSKSENTNYLNNRDMLKNIHLSKASYTWYIDGTWRDTNYLNYDIILCDDRTFEDSIQKLILQKINKYLLESGEKRTSSIKESYKKMLTDEDYEEIYDKIVLFEGDIESNKDLLRKVRLHHYNRKLYEQGKKRVSDIDDETLNSIPVEDLVVRVFTYKHIEDKPEEEIKKRKTVADEKTKLNFPPYMHYGYYNGKFQCVAKSHHDKNENFSIHHGNINDKLALAFIKLCARYASRYNWRGYSYSDDMQGKALVQLTSVGLQFNELFSSNPFSYYTSTIKHSFTVVLNEEKHMQEIRDDLLVDNDQSPSWTKQLESDMSRTEHWDKILDNNNLHSSVIDENDNTNKSNEEDNESNSEDDITDEKEDEIEFVDQYISNN